MTPLENQTRLDASLDSILKKQEAVMELFINSKPFLLEAMKLREASNGLVELAVLWHGREAND